jgi:hypothetical protein
LDPFTSKAGFIDVLAKFILNELNEFNSTPTSKGTAGAEGEILRLEDTEDPGLTKSGRVKDTVIEVEETIEIT